MVKGKKDGDQLAANWKIFLEALSYHVQNGEKYSHMVVGIMKKAQVIKEVLLGQEKMHLSKRLNKNAMGDETGTQITRNFRRYRALASKVLEFEVFSPFIRAPLA